MMPLFASVSDEVLIVIAIPLVGGVLVAITAILAGTYRKMQRDDMTATLKMEMILSLIQRFNLRLGGYSIWSASSSCTT